MSVQLQDAEDTREVLDVDLAGVIDGDKDTVYVLKPIGIDEHRAIVKRHTTEILDRRSHQKVPKTDFMAVADDVLDFVLVDWRGILFRGQPAPCTREHKMRLDYVRRQALSDLAGLNQIQRAPEVRAESFREPA